MEQLNNIHINPFSLIYGVLAAAMAGGLAWLMLYIAKDVLFPQWKAQTKRLVAAETLSPADAKRLLSKERSPNNTFFRFLAAGLLVACTAVFGLVMVGMVAPPFNPSLMDGAGAVINLLMYLTIALPFFGGLWLLLCGGSIQAAFRIAQLADPKSSQDTGEESFVSSLKHKSASEIRMTGVFLLLIGGYMAVNHMPAEAWPYLHKALIYTGFEALWPA